MLLKAALNGARTPADHPALPCTPAQLASDAHAAVAAGAGALHVHPRSAAGAESLAATDVARALEAVRAACPGVPVGVTTGAWIVPDPVERADLIDRWKVRPDFASVNFHEEGSVAVARLLLAVGVEVEAGLATERAAKTLLASGLAERCLRILIEPDDLAVEGARKTVERIEKMLDAARIATPRLLHGRDATAWAMLRLAGERGYGTRIGLEDVLTLPDGTPADGNASLVRAARELLGR